MEKMREDLNALITALEKCSNTRKNRDELKEKFNETLENYKKEYFKKLEGSEKQINWANKIKAQKLVDKLFEVSHIDIYIASCDDEYSSKFGNVQFRNNCLEQRENLIQDIMNYTNITSAKKIIETR